MMALLQEVGAAVQKAVPRMPLLLAERWGTAAETREPPHQLRVWVWVRERDAAQESLCLWVRAAAAAAVAAAVAVVRVPPFLPQCVPLALWIPAAWVCPSCRTRS